MLRQFVFRVGATTLGVILGCAIYATVVQLTTEAGPPPGSGSGDVNGDGSVDIGDAISLLSFLFSGGPAPVACAGPSCAACDLTPSEVDKLIAFLPMVTVGAAGDLTISAGGDIALQGGSTATLSSSGSVTITAGTTLDANGSLITLN